MEKKQKNEQKKNKFTSSDESNPPNWKNHFLDIMKVPAENAGALWGKNVSLI